MNPPAPVTRTLRPAHDSDRSALRDGTYGNLLRMRVLVCVPWYAPARGFGGGILTSLLATVEGALEAGHDVTVATTDLLDSHSRIPPDAPTEVAGAQVLRFPNISHRLAASHAPLPRGLRHWLREHMREFDVVLI